MVRVMRGVVGIAVLLASCFAGEDVPPPRIASVQPDHGAPGIVVQINGDHLCQQPDAPEDDAPPCDPTSAQVLFDTTTAETSLIDDTSATATVPALPSGVVSVRIAVNGRNSNRVDFTVEP